MRESLRQALEDLGSDFELVRELGRGTTAVVYLLRDRALGRDVAMKVIRSSFGQGEEAVARLQREARLVAQLQHPNIVKLFGTRQLSDGSLALLMEHVPGRNLKEILQAEGPLSPARTLSILRDVASALAYAHRRRIVHRDVKPENIYLDEEVGTARLADFGVARPWDRSTRLTLPGESLGTPAYMSPEQIDDREVDGRSDVYSLGLVGYEMLLGEHPWESENLFSIIYKQKNEEPPSLAEARQDVPPRLVAALEKAYRKDPVQRWSSAEAFLDRISNLDAPGPADVFGAWDEPDSEPAPDRPPAEDRDGREERPIEPPAATTPAPPPAAREGTHAPSTAEPAGAAWLEAMDVEEVDPEQAVVDEPAPTGPLFDAETERYLREHTFLEEPDPAPARRGERGPTGRRALTAVGLVAVLAVAGFGWYAIRGDDAASAGGPEGPPAVPGEMGAGAPADFAADPAAAGGAAALQRTLQNPVTAPVGTDVVIEVLLEGGDGAPVAGAPVAFSLLEGDGRLLQDEGVTDAEGIARAGFVLGRAPGPALVQARAASDSVGGETTVEIPVEGVPGPPARAAILLGDGQEGLPGRALETVLGVRVTDALANPVPGAEVRFQVVGGGGRVGPGRTTTDSLGRAFARWTLGPDAGVQQVAAMVPQADEALLTFSATAASPEAAPPTSSAETDPPAEAGEAGEAQAGVARPGDVAEDPGEATPTLEAPPPETEVDVVARPFVVGGAGVCGIGDGAARCRGGLPSGQSPSRFVALAAGVSHLCGLSDGGAAYCWGANESGQVGNGTRTDPDVPAPVETPIRFSQLAAGLSHTCGLDAAGRALCWGRNISGQLGDGSREDRLRPVPARTGTAFRAVAAGWNHTCALDAGGRARCWGLNGDGQLGDGSRVDRLVPTSVSGSPAFQALAAGSGHTCGRAGGQVLCWGDNAFGQLGSGGASDRTEPTPVELPAPAARLVVGAVHTCALLENGETWCWGQNLHGQVGDGTNENRPTPVRVVDDPGFRSIFAGGAMTCGVSGEGVQYCWGLNQSGQLGDGTRTNRAAPTRVGG